jgi:hypothetical protein
MVANRALWLFVGGLFLGACAADEPATGLHITDAEGVVFGPHVVFEPLAKPDAELPFPNDLAIAISADGSAHISTSMQAPTRMERRLRTHLNQVPGFSAMSPISISFDGPLDLKTVTDDSVLVINVTPGSHRFGEVMPIDLGRGWFPHTANPHRYFPHDPLGDFNSFVLPPDNKIDSDGDGTPDKWVYHYEVATNTLDIRPLVPLQAGTKYAVVLTRDIEGLTKDGTTRGSIKSPFANVNHASQTAALQHVVPVLKARGKDAKDVAFAWTMTTGDLSRTFRALRAGLYGEGNFAWLDAAFPAKLENIYPMNIEFDGLNDDHPNAHPAKKGYPYVKMDHDFIIQGAFMNQIFKIVANFAPEVGGSFANTDYAVFGDMKTPSFRQTEATDTTERNVWDVNLEAGTATVKSVDVPFMLTVPKTTANHKPPFPVIVYSHATGTSRIESLLLADKFARAGIATFTIDAVGHGPVLANARQMIGGFLGGSSGSVFGCNCKTKKCDPGGLPEWRKPVCKDDDKCASVCQSEDQLVSVVSGLLGSLLYKKPAEKFPEGTTPEALFTEMEKNGFLQQLAVLGRGVDDNGDCELNGTPGEAYYAPNTFRLRDSMRQTTLDYIVAVRLLRSFTAAAVPPAVDDPRALEKTPEGTKRLMQNLLAGDFNGDGVLDIGGPNVPYFMTGVSLGGIHTALTAPLEPHIVAVAPIVAGAGLADIFVRTRLNGVITPFMHKVSGPKLIGCARKDGNVRISWNDDSGGCKRDTMWTYKAPTGQCLTQPIQVQAWVEETTDIKDGTKLRATNLVNGEVGEVVAFKGGAFAVAVASDKGDTIRLEVMEGGKAVKSFEMKSPYEGVARARNSPRFRRFVQTSSNILEGADAITVADRMFRRPLEQGGETHVLLTAAVGDQTVNFAAGLALARAIGLFGEGDPTDTKPYKVWTEKMIAAGVLRDKLSAPTVPLDPTSNPGMCNIVKSGAANGVSAFCLADVQGKHEYIAQPSKADRFPKIPGYDDTTYTEYHRNMIVSFFHSLGTKVATDPCWASPTCMSDKAKGKGLVKEWDKPIAKVALPVGLK